VSLFVWRFLRDRIPTKDNLLRRRVLQSNDTTCVVGCGNQETAEHLFLGCSFRTTVWSHVWNWLGISSVPDGVIRNHFVQFSNMAGMPRCSHSFLQVVWFAWVLWKERNNRVFQNTASDPSAIIKKVKLNSFLWLKSKRLSFSSFCYHDWWKQPLSCMGVHL